MKLSDAILLGDTLKKAKANAFFTLDGSCGCALAGALLANGVDGGEFAAGHAHKFTRAVLSSCGILGLLAAHTGHDDTDIVYTTFAEMEDVKRLWPWLTVEHIKEISDMYKRVVLGEISIEVVAAYARSIEPSEQVTEFVDFCHALESEISDVKMK